MSRRPERLAEILREEISEVVGFELDDPRLEAVTVTDVKVADDLRNAKVYVLIQGSEREAIAAMEALRHASVFVRRQVALNLSIRHVPVLHFCPGHGRRKCRSRKRTFGEIASIGRPGRIGFSAI